MSSNYPKGSEWRKWDLHLHSPKTFLNNRYKDCSIEDFIQKIEVNKIKVAGITNYFHFHEQDLGEIKKKLNEKDILVLPNLEFRTQPQNKQGETMHIHIIFSEKVSLEKINNFLGRLRTIDDKYCKDLQQKDIEKTSITFDILKTKLDEDKEIKHYDDYLLVACPRGQGDFRPSENDDGRGNNLAVTIDRNTDILFGTGNDTDFFLNRENSRYKGSKAKAVVSCSDAHEIDEIGNRFTWVKADPTFEGLKQIIYDPEERVRIQELEPEDKPSYQIIDRVEYESKNAQKEIIYFNRNLNSVIGSRANGKSNLLKNIAFSVDYKQCQFKNIEESKLLHLKNFKVFWKDGSVNSLSVEEKKEKGILFIPQGYLGRLLDKESQFDLFLADLFGNKNDFKECLETYKKFEDQNVLEITSLIRELLRMYEGTKQKQDEIIKHGKKSDLDDEIERIEKNIEEVNKKGDSITQAELEKYKNLNEQKNNKNLELSKAVKNLNSFEQLKKEDVITMERIFDFDFSEEYLKAILEKIKESDEKFKSEFIDKELLKLKQLENNIKLKIQEIDKDIKPLKDKLEKHKALLDLTKNLQDKKIVFQRIITLTKETKNLINELQIKIDELVKKYILFSSQYKKLNVEINNLEFSSFEVITDFNEENFKNFLEENINYHNSLTFKDRKQNLYKNANQLLQDPAKWSYEEKDIIEALKQILNGILSGILLLKSGKDKESMIQELFKNRFKINFSKSITNKHGEEFDNMSDGEKMIALLEFIFLFDDYNYPVLLDQPEDDLDVKAISKNVVDFIKKQKRKRQVIIASHNANLVVCGDSENVIVANKSKGMNPNFKYFSGAIESEELRKSIIGILEGGEEALRKRKDKLGIKN